MSNLNDYANQCHLANKKWWQNPATSELVFTIESKITEDGPYYIIDPSNVLTTNVGQTFSGVRSTPILKPIDTMLPEVKPRIIELED